MSSAKARSAHARAILGSELYDKLPNTKVLLVGAGGIGCELLKNIVLVGFGEITLLDLDTIDLSNLNRQFLFRKKDVKQSKALVTAQTAASFNPNVSLNPIHGNIKEPQYDIPWFQQFDIVLNALDNLDARRHVNKMCMAAQVPLVESGTAGYLGQVQPLLKDHTECFDCIPKPTPKTYPVCTIRSTPSQPIHCIVWSKSYLLGQLFGEDEDAIGELDAAEQEGENAREIATLRQEAQAFNNVRAALRSTSPDICQHAAKHAFQKVFNDDINNLLVMADMWKSRAPPVPLDFDTILDGTFILRDEGMTSNGAGLKDQKALSLKDNVELFVHSTNRLAARLRSGNETTISFDKDDDDTLDFVTAASNLRSAAYGINRQTRWEVKEMAGNIIPAIATTNAIISGLIVLQALHLLRRNYSAMRNVHLQYKPAVPLSTITLSKPNSGRALLGDIVKGVLGVNSREVSVYEDKRVLSDPDWDDNLDRTLESLNVTRGKFLSLVDEEGEWRTITIGLNRSLDRPVYSPDNSIDAPPYILPSPLPQPSKMQKLPPAESAPATPLHISKKRLLPIDMDSDIIDLAPTPKRLKPDPNGAVKDQESPKRRRLEEEGLILVDGPGGLADIIVID
ncbi:Ubiquitin-activating enzyme E1-like [Termitomyces sp. J132]|nr:Ubiquitin-activating enzyme E1-like [Termitomyces sp. J132]